MQAAALDANLISFSKGITSLMELFQVDVKQAIVDKIERSYVKLNKDFDAIDFDGISPEEAAEKLTLIVGLRHSFFTMMIRLETDNRIAKKYKTPLLKQFKLTAKHLEETVEALEIYSDTKAMQDLDRFLSKSAQYLLYKVESSKSVDKFSAKLQGKVKSQYQKWRTDRLSSDPHNAHEGKVQKFKFKGVTAYKKRFGATRFIFTIDEKKLIVFIFKGDNRDDVYK